MPGAGVLTLTGQQGEVMQESVQAALAWIRSNADQLGLAPRSGGGGGGGSGGSGGGSGSGSGAPEASSDASLLQGVSLLQGTDLHVHFPAGAVKKDGPSAGLAVTCALVSLLSGRLARSDTAMTGEVSLRGHVLAVGGVRAKVDAAHRISHPTATRTTTTHSIRVPSLL